MRKHLFTALLATLIPIHPAAAQATVRVVVDSARQEIILSVGPIDIAPSTPYTHHAAEAYHVVQWPASGWLRGYRVDLVDSTGRLLPRELLHHAGMANLDRRQVAYPIAERVFAAAHETAPVVFPKAMGIPLSAGQRMVMYYGLVNPDTVAIRGAVLQVRIGWADAKARGITAILPFYANAMELSAGTISFDVPVGRSATASEFTVSSNGWLRVVGGHLHDHGVELRIEDAETNKVLAHIRGKRTAEGRMVDVRRVKFLLKRRGLRLRAGHRYRVVAVYDNPTGSVIKGGAMGFVAGAFIPENVAALERVDANDLAYVRDVRKLMGGGQPAGGHAHH